MGFSYKTKHGLKKDCIEFSKLVAKYDFSENSDLSLAEIAAATDEVQATAAIKEIIFRLTGKKLFDSQIQTAYSLFCGHITELPTGEGKTLSAVVAAILFAKRGRKVHILVFNDYLAHRDAEENRAIYEFVGVSVSCVTESTEFSARKAAYECDVMYAPAREAGYDCIRNFIAEDEQHYITADYDVAIVDEADSILIDEAAVPLVLAGKADPVQIESLKKIVAAVQKLKPQDYELNTEEHQIWLTDQGIAKIEAAFQIENLYGDENFEILSGVNTALEAVFLLKCDEDYIVKDGKIAVIDDSTGRVAANRKFPGILHKFVELKENVADGINTRIYCNMTIGAYIKQYKTLCGMTGTAATSASEFETTYGVRTVVIDPHNPCVRVDLPDEVFLTDAERDEAVLADILATHQKGQPILMGTASVAESERLAKLLLENNIKCNVLNARNDEAEAAIIAEAGQLGAVTVSTNMAGRGVDIKLGGANEANKAAVVEVGGLYVISTTINRSRRIDNQLRGRAGRQGDVGQSKFYISLENENIAPVFEADANSKKPLTVREKLSAARDAQYTLEGNDAEARYAMKKYTYIIEEQRQIISNYRNKILFRTKLPNVLREDDFDKYLELEKQFGIAAVEDAERQIMLYYLNHHFSNYLEAVEEIKSSIHLNVVAGKNPLDEFNRSTIDAFDEMNRDIRFDVLNAMQNIESDKNGLVVQKFALQGATGTWTYMVDDNSGQFNHLPELLNMITNKIKKSLSVSDRLENFFNRNK